MHAAGGSKTKSHKRSQSARIPEEEEGKPSGEESDYSAGPSSSDLEMDDMRSDEELDDDEETGLTHADRRKRRRRKRKNTRLDERVMGDGKITKEEERLATATMLKTSLINGLLIGLWYTFSISISVYNKWMFSKDGKGLDFHFPLFTTCVHMLVQFTLASLVLYFIPSLRPGHTSSNPHHAHCSQLDNEENASEPPAGKKPLMTKMFYLTRIGPCGTATALDIGLGNTSLKFISLTFFTMCKSSVLAFVLLFAFLFRLEKPSWKLGAIIFFMTVGVVMMVAGETAFNAAGFILIMSASFFSGFRWSLTQILLLRNPATSNPFSSIFFLAPVMFVALLVIALPAEGPAQVIAGFHTLAADKGAVLGVVLLLFPGVLAFLMTASEFALLKRTSVVTLSVCGIFKEVLTISAAGIVFGDKLTPINISGLLVTIASIAAYNYIKIMKMRSEARREAHEIIEEQGAAPVLGRTEEGRKASVVADDVVRNSTSSLIRHSLSVQTNGELVKKSIPNGVAADRERASPVKRPENLE